MKNFVREFKEFAMRGNVVDLAVGVLIGGSFGSIVTSLVNDILMPIIAAISGSPNFTYLKLLLVDKGEDSIYLNYGNFIQVVVNFLIIAFCVFIVVKALNSLKKKEEPAPASAPVESDETKALKEIIEILKNK